MDMRLSLAIVSASARALLGSRRAHLGVVRTERIRSIATLQGGTAIPHLLRIDPCEP